MADHPFPPGTRVRHYGQQYPEALEGTATVLEVHEERTGGWEYLVQRDRPIFPDSPNQPTWWASYHTIKGFTTPIDRGEVDDDA